MEAQELRIGNYFLAKGNIYSVEYIAKNSLSGKTINLLKNFSEGFTEDKINGVPLSEEILLKCGAVLNTKSKIMKCYWLHLKRDLYLNFSDIGTPNFIVSIICFDEGIITDLNIIHNWDHEKEMYLHTLQNIFQSLTNQELEINL